MDAWLEYIIEESRTVGEPRIPRGTTA